MEKEGSNRQQNRYRSVMIDGFWNEIVVILEKCLNEESLNTQVTP